MRYRASAISFIILLLIHLNVSFLIEFANFPTLLSPEGKLLCYND